METLSLIWRGATVEFKPSFDLFLRIEEKVSFARLTEEISKAGQGNTAELAMSHVAWVLYCCLRHAGAAVRTPMEVHQALFDGAGTIDHGGILAGLIVAYYGSQPEKMPKKKPAANPTPSPRLNRKSRNATVSP
ncbi:MAG TPA: hypothetical protein VGA88_14275 [Burkholderiales bacterium]